jgi:outer membrane protein OmpA-like peptidoglycan-associated protein
MTMIRIMIGGRAGNGRAFHPALPLLAAGLLLTACASGPRTTPALTQATQSVATARTNPAVVQSAALELQRAEETLRQAQALSADRADASAIDHQAYLADRQAAIAQQTAALRQGEGFIADADAQRARAMLQTRTAQAQAANARAAELQRQLAAMQAEQTERGIVLTLGDVLFDVDKATLKPGADWKLDRLADFLIRYPQRTVEIDGFTDSTGSSSHNQELSDQRADAVRAALVGRGIDPRRIVARGFGAALPVAGNDSAAGRQRNRRVEVTISDEQGRIPPRGPTG